MHSTLAKACGLVLAATTLAALPSEAGAVTQAHTTFVVNTQFWDDASPIVGATGPLAVCTSVQDLGGDGVNTGPNTVLFFGTKRLNCTGGTVTVSYVATLNFRTGRKTSGTWQVVESTLAGVTSGGGTLKGDNARCEVLAGSDGCILDAFAGNVSG